MIASAGGLRSKPDCSTRKKARSWPSVPKRSADAWSENATLGNSASGSDSVRTRLSFSNSATVKRCGTPSLAAA